MNHNFEFLVVKERHDDRLRRAEKGRLIRELEAQQPQFSARRLLSRLVQQLSPTKPERPRLSEEFGHRPATQKS